MVTQAASLTHDFLFRSNVYPFLHNTAYLPRYEDDSRTYHEHGDPLPCPGKGCDVAEAHCCECNNREIERIAEILHIGIHVIFHMKKHSRGNEEYDEYR